MITLYIYIYIYMFGIQFHFILKDICDVYCECIRSEIGLRSVLLVKISSQLMKLSFIESVTKCYRCSRRVQSSLCSSFFVEKFLVGRISQYFFVCLQTATTKDNNRRYTTATKLRLILEQLFGMLTSSFWWLEFLPCYSSLYLDTISMDIEPPPLSYLQAKYRFANRFLTTNYLFHIPLSPTAPFSSDICIRNSKSTYSNNSNNFHYSPKSLVLPGFVERSNAEIELN